MAQGWRQLLEAGMQVGEMTRGQAQSLVRQLVKEGQVAEGRARAYAEELLERSRRRTEELRKLVQREIASQLSALGLATKEDLARLEKKLTKASGTRKPASRKPAAKKAAGAKGSAEPASRSARSARTTRTSGR